MAREACECLLTVLKIPPARYRLGVSRVFLAAQAQHQLHRRVRHACIVLTGRAVRRAGGLGAMRRWRAQRRKVLVALQSLARRAAATRRFESTRSAALALQYGCVWI